MKLDIRIFLPFRVRVVPTAFLDLENRGATPRDRRLDLTIAAPPVGVNEKRNGNINFEFSILNFEFPPTPASVLNFEF